MLLTLLFGLPVAAAQGRSRAKRTTLPPYAWVGDGKVVIPANVVASVVAGECAGRIELGYR
ncbi:MAG: hypothetical protein H6720_21645 [Sandaracinus sp.]|nr:hypothetical protein [Sandaracinus sp.]